MEPPSQATLEVVYRRTMQWSAIIAPKPPMQDVLFWKPQKMGLKVHQLMHLILIISHSTSHNGQLTKKCNCVNLLTWLLLFYLKESASWTGAESPAWNAEQMKNSIVLFWNLKCILNALIHENIKSFIKFELTNYDFIAKNMHIEVFGLTSNSVDIDLTHVH